MQIPDAPPLTLPASAALTAPEVAASLPPPPRPTQQAERITSLDVLRGFALLGILLMNIVGFGLYHVAYDNPTAAGGATGLNLATWVFLHITAEGTMRCLFSLVFGASVILFTSKLEGRPDSGDLYYRRTLWLMVFGVAHLFLLWQGEILYYYAICALVLYPFRNLRPRNLILIAAAGLVLLAGFDAFSGYDKREMIEKGRAAAEKAARHETLTEDETDEQRKWEDFAKERNPSAEKLRKNAEACQGSFTSVVKERGTLVMKWYSMPYFHPWMFDVWSMMFLGMALFKLGVLSGRRPLGLYVAMLAGGYGIGFTLNSYTAWRIVGSNFDPLVQQFSFVAYNLARLSVACGHLGLLLILCQKGWLRWLTVRLGAIGQTAFSNYILQSLVCAFTFTGYGFGLYGKLERHQLYYVVAGSWVVALIISPIWLRHFRYGPLEWCWRSLTYWKRQPFRRATEPEPGPTPAVVSA